MLSVLLVFCDCGFHSVCPLMDEDKRLVEGSRWEGLAVGKTGSYSGGHGHALLLLLLSLQSCPTLCNHMDSSLPGSSVPGILQARILEWVAISFSNACMHAKLLQSFPTLCDPMDSSPPGSSVYGILQARILEWVAISSSMLS